MIRPVSENYATINCNPELHSSKNDEAFYYVLSAEIFIQ